MISVTSAVTLENTIVAFGTQSDAVYCEGGGSATLSCCDLYGNAGGDWVGCIADQYGVNGNISENPLFCNLNNGPFTIAEDSPCAPFSPPNDECDLIGAWPVEECVPVGINEPSSSSTSLQLLRSAPNPFQTSTIISYVIPVGAEDSPALLRIYDPVGRLVRTLVQTPRPSGSHTVLWDGTNQAGTPVAGGVYFYQLKLNERVQTKSLILVR
jgi:hypothetical protein